MNQMEHHVLAAQFQTPTNNSEKLLDGVKLMRQYIFCHIGTFSCLETYQIHFIS